MASRDGSAPQPTLLLLVRHGVTAETGSVLSGRAPGIDLSEDGRRQAEAAAERLARLPVAAVYASPIERTWQTAEPIAARHGLEVVALPGAVEADYGQWTGQRLRELSRTPLWRTVQATPSLAAFPSGESIRAMQARMVDALESVVARHPGQHVAVVSHADPIKAAVAHFAGLHLDLFQRLTVSPASVTALVLGAGAPVLAKLNDTGSLEDLRPPSPKRRAERRARAGR